MPLSTRETAYKISVVSPGSKDSLTTPISGKRKAVRSVTRKVVNAVMVLMLAFLGLFVSIGAASPAQANFVDDGFKSAFCSTGMFNYELQSKTGFLSANTGDENTYDATPYEKYGLQGMWFTTWLGPERQEGLDDSGEFGGVSIVNFVGGEGNSDIDMIGDKEGNAKDGKANQTYPGFYNSQQTCAPVMAVGTTAVSNSIFAMTGIIVFVANFIYQAAAEGGAAILTVADSPLTLIVNSLKDAVFFEFLTPIVMLGALWMAWTGLVKKSSMEAAQGALWMIGSAVASVALLSNPMVIPNTVHSVVTSVSSAIITGVSSVGSGDPDNDTMCAVNVPKTEESDALRPGEAPKASTPAPLSNATRANVRQFQCVMWNNFLYTPWVMGEFNENPASPAKDGPLLAGWAEASSGGSINGQPALAPVDNVSFNKSGSSPAPAGVQNWALYHLDNKVKFDGSKSDELIEQKRSLINVAVAQLHTEDYNSTYKGDDSANRLAIVTLSIVAAAGASLFILIVGASIIILQLSIILLTLMAPLALLAGVHPGFGRRIALGWLEQIVGLAIKQIVLSFFLGIILSFYSMIFMINTGGLGWMMSMLLIVLGSIAGFKFKNQMLEMFSRITPGGYDAGNEGGGKGRGAAKRLLAGTLGAVGGAGMAGIAGRSKSGQKTGVDKVSEAMASSQGAGMRVAPKNSPGSAPAPRRNQKSSKNVPETPSETQAQVPSSESHTSERPQERVKERKEQSIPQSIPESHHGPVDPAETAPVSTPVPAIPLTRKQELKERKRIYKELNEAGYRSRVGVGTVAKAALKGAVVGTVTGRPMAGVRASSAVVAKGKVEMEKRNSSAVEGVTAAEKARVRASLPAPKKTVPQERSKEGTKSSPVQQTIPRSAPKAQPESPKKGTGNVPRSAPAPAPAPKVSKPQNPTKGSGTLPHPTPRIGQPESSKKSSGSLPPLHRPVPRPKPKDNN